MGSIPTLGTNCSVYQPFAATSAVVSPAFVHPACFASSALSYFRLGSRAFSERNISSPCSVQIRAMSSTARPRNPLPCSCCNYVRVLGTAKFWDRVAGGIAVVIEVVAIGCGATTPESPLAPTTIPSPSPGQAPVPGSQYRSLLGDATQWRDNNSQFEEQDGRQ